METKLHGVNLGGWLVLEKWMTPTFFKDTEAVDEYSFMPTPGAVVKLERHRQTFITEEDFQWLAVNGINAVRIPVGHWIFGDTPPYTGCISYLDWAIDMAARYGLQVIIDLHRAPGSQDGHDTGVEPATPGWFDDPAHQARTIEVLVRLVERYRSAPNVWGLELVNEPKINFKRFFELRRFYRQAYATLTQVARPGLRIIVSDGFVPRLMSGVIRATSDNPVILDVHLYQFMEPFDNWRTLDGHLRRASTRRLLIWFVQLRQPAIIGEWSAVISGKKMRRVSQSRQRIFEKQYVRRQQRAYRYASGQFYWNYKTEGRGVWNFRSMVEDGSIEVQQDD